MTPITTKVDDDLLAALHVEQRRQSKGRSAVMRDLLRQALAMPDPAPAMVRMCTRMPGGAINKGPPVPLLEGGPEPVDSMALQVWAEPFEGGER